MIPASRPRPLAEHRVLVVGDRTVSSAALPALFGPGDVVVVNDAATLPASIPFVTERGEPVEVRLAQTTAEPDLFVAVLLGIGPFRSRTEDRPPPPPLAVGSMLRGDGVRARIVRSSSISPRLVELRFDGPSPIVDIFRVGKPVQYAHVDTPLALWDVTNAWASRPWAVEMPSAGRVLSVGAVLALRARGVEVLAVTHGAGLSATGDPAIDASLPLPERYLVPEETARAVRRANRVIAVGTSVVRALESAGPNGGEGVTDLRIDARTQRRVVDAILTGTHDPGTSHFDLLRAFASASALGDALRRSEVEGLVGHELGDLWLIWGEPSARVRDAGGVRSARVAA